MGNTTPQKKMPTWRKVLIGFVLFALLVNVFAIFLPGSPDLTPEQQKEIARQDSIKAKADSIQVMLNSIRYTVKKTVKDNLKDPDSFEEIDHQEFQVSNPTPLMFYQASIKYRAKNSFGGFVIEKHCFNFLENGVMSDSFKCD